MARRDPPWRRLSNRRGGWTVLLCAVLVILTFVAYVPVRRADYVQDDHVAVEDNPIVARGDLREIFSTHYWAGARGEDRTLYRPVTIASYALERGRTGQPDAGVSHAINVLLHVLASLTLLGLVRRLGAGLPVAGVTALLFAVHPVHVEAVAGIVGRAEILATLFSLAALWTYTYAGRWEGVEASAVHHRNGVHRLAAWVTAGMLFLALGSKENAIALVVLIPALDVLFRPPAGWTDRRWWLERAATLAPCVLAAGVFFILRILAIEALAGVQRPHPIDNPLVLLDGPERYATAIALLARYAGLLVFPVTLSADYSGGAVPAERGLLAPLPLVGLVLLSGLVLLALLPLAKRSESRRGAVPSGRPLAPRRIAAFGALLFLLPYLVVSNLLVPVGAIFAERFMYFPSSGFCLLAALFLGHLGFDYPAFRQWTPEQRVRYSGLVTVILLAAFAMRTFSAASVWRDDRTVFAAAARARPESPRAHFIVGKLAADDGRIDEAVEHLRQAIRNAPTHVPAHIELGIALAARGDLEEAAELFREAIRLSPVYSTAHLNLGLALHRLDRLEEAVRSVRKAIVLDPDLAKSWAALGHLYYQTGEIEKSAEAYRRAIVLGRSDLAPRLRELEQRLRAGVPSSGFDREPPSAFGPVRTPREEPE